MSDSAMPDFTNDERVAILQGLMTLIGVSPEAPSEELKAAAGTAYTKAMLAWGPQ